VLAPGQERTQRWRVAFRRITREPDQRRVARGKGAREEGASGRGVTMVPQVHVDDLPVFVEAAEVVPLVPANLEQDFVHASTRPDG
jgi:hypothetical protein